MLAFVSLAPFAFSASPVLPHTMFGYYENAQVIPRYRIAPSYFNYTAQSELSATTLDTGSDIEWMALKCDRNQTNCIMATLDDEGEVQAQARVDGVWGSVVDVAPNIGTTNDESRGFDVAFEYSRGWGLVIAGNNTARPYYRIWYPENNTWSGVEQFPNSACGTSNTPAWVEAASKPNSKEILMAYMDSGGRFCAYVWNGSAWGNSKSIYNTTFNSTQKTFCVAYEQSSGRGVVFWEEAKSAQLNHANWTGSAWEVGSLLCNPSCVAGSNYVWFSCASMPGTNRIMWASPVQTSGMGGGDTAGNEVLSFASISEAVRRWSDFVSKITSKIKTPRLRYVAADLAVREWNQGFGTPATFTGAVEGDFADRQLADVAYLGGSGHAMVVYSPDGTNFPNYRTCTSLSNCQAGTWGSASATTATACGTAGNVDLVRLISNTANNDTMLIYSTQHANEPICYQLYNATMGYWHAVTTLEDSNRFLSNARPFEATFYNDSKPPLVSFVSPTPSNGSSSTDTYIYTNVSSRDSNNHSAFLDWNNALVGWWEMDFYNSTVVFDNSSYGNNATFTGADFGTSNLTASTRGLGLAFDGVNDYLSVNNPGRFNLTSNMTWVGWIKGGGNRVLSRFQNSTNKYMLLLSNTAPGFLQMYMMKDGTEFNFSASNIPVKGDTWFHFALLFFDNGTYNLYINGVNRSYTTTLNFGSLPSGSDAFEIGKLAGSTGYFNGTLDSIQIYNRTLTAQEINASYNAESYQYYNNFTGLSAGTYTAKAWAIDDSGNVNNTGLYSFTVSSQEPAFKWQSFNITNASAYSQDTIVFFANFSDDNGTSEVNLTFDHVNGSITNYTMSLYNGSNKNGVWNYNISSNLLAGTFRLNYTAHDGNTANSSSDFEMLLYSNSSIGIVAYYQFFNNGPKYRNWTAGWSAEGSGTSFFGLGEDIEWTRVECNPLENACIGGFLDDTGVVHAQLWRNYTWGSDQRVVANIGTTNDNYRGFDIAFEKIRGWGLVITANNTDTPYYRIWYPENNTWSGTEKFQVNDSCAGIPLWVEARAKPLSDEIVVTYQDSANDVCTYFWNGSQFGTPVTHTAITNAVTRKTMCTAYEQQTGNALVLFETLAGVLTFRIHYVNNDTWSSATSVGSGSLVGINWLDCTSRPASNRVMAAISYRTSSHQLDAIEWNGSAWGTQTTLVSNGAPAVTFQDRKTADVAYLGGSGGAMVVYAGRYQNSPLERRCTTASNCFAGTWTSARNTTSDICGTGNSGSEQTDSMLVRLVPDAFSNDTMLIYNTNHSNEPICGQHYNSSRDTWSPVTLFENTNSVYPNATNFDFAFNFTGINNVSRSCRDIHAGESFTMSQNVTFDSSSGRTACYDFIGGSATLDCAPSKSNFYYVIDGSGNSGIGLRAIGRNSLSIVECSMMNFTTAAYLVNSTGTMSSTFARGGISGLNFTYNQPAQGSFNGTTTTLENMSYGITLSGLNTSRFIVNTLSSVSNAITFSSNAHNNTFFNTTITNASTAIKATDSNNLTFVELLLALTGTNPHLLLTNSLDNYFLSANVSPSRTSLVTANYTVAYYARGNVTYCENSTAFNGANVSFYSTQANYLDSTLSGSDGLTGFRNVSSFAEYYDAGGDLEVTVNYTPHKFYANASGYVNDTQTVYLSTNTTQALCLNVVAVLDLSLLNHTVNFSDVSVGNDYYSDNASGLGYRYFILQNDGNVQMNITITGSAPFSRNTTPMPDTWYRFNASDYEPGSLASACPAPFNNYNSWYNVNETGQSGVPYALCKLGYSDSADSAKIAINWRIPSDEPAGAKTSTTTFTASQS
ncbi:MAG: LamG domain-containing protein [Candidatus Norongarragalinales archaeon]